MNQRRGRAIRSAGGWIVPLVLFLGSFAAASAEVVTLNGEVDPAAYDEETGNLVSVAIFDSEWGSVLVSPGGKGAELLGHVGAVVTVTGTIEELGEDSDYEYAIKVTSYTIDESAEPEEEPEDDPERMPDEGE
jgi:hypothetical protein